MKMNVDFALNFPMTHLAPCKCKGTSKYVYICLKAGEQLIEIIYYIIIKYV